MSFHISTQRDKKVNLALYTVIGDWNSARLSDVGKWGELVGHSPIDETMWSEEDWLIPLDESINIDVSEFTVEGDWVRVHVIRSLLDYESPEDREDTPGPLWGCFIHEACWDFLCATDIRFQNPRTLQALFDICRSLPQSEGILDWGHNYGGMVKYDPDPEMLFPGEEPDRPILIRPEVFGCTPDPMENHLAKFLDSQSEPRTNMDQTLKFRASTGTDPFSRLPSEVLLEILVRSDTKSVENFRLASKVVANLGRPEKFFSSRFWPGREFDYHFELASCQTLDCKWRHAYVQARILRRGRLVKNRRRVWALACKLRDCVTLRLEAPVCHGSPLGASDDRKWLKAEHTPKPLKFLHGRIPRFLNETVITISGHNSEAWASLVTLNDKCYVSGFRIVQSDGESIELGYRHPGHEVAFTWDEYPESGDLFAGFHVAFDTKGIRGLRMISAQGVPSSWIGYHKGLTKMSIICKDQVQAVRGGFDALKMMSISVYSPDEGKEENKASMGKASRCPWYPDLPDPKLQILEVKSVPLDRLDILPYSICMFGGKDGELLPNLIEIVVWIQTRKLSKAEEAFTRVWAVEFHYDSQKGGVQSLMLGRVPESRCRRYEMSIDGPNGERITGFEAKYKDSDIPSGFSFYTNHGRSLHAPEEGAGRILRHVESFHPAQGTPVGFFAALSHEDGFQNTGLLCIPS
ncbi:hypothetical protein CEP54_007154 [Fusarium duplospermum]|uniref:DUF7600 domain-containing protein n=1 Tax=Fusarium duplospermum TaxID=1325734 RepID=A0A428Q309_9HYPO|nr:hypothetical protein CEP54_007154 [Fusarium duplospermum]